MFFHGGHVLRGEDVRTGGRAILSAYGGDYFAFVLIGVAFAAYHKIAGLNSLFQSLRQEQF